METQQAFPHQPRFLLTDWYKVLILETTSVKRCTPPIRLSTPPCQITFWIPSYYAQMICRVQYTSPYLWRASIQTLTHWKEHVNVTRFELQPALFSELALQKINKHLLNQEALWLLLGPNYTNSAWFEHDFVLADKLPASGLNIKVLTDQKNFFMVLEILEEVPPFCASTLQELRTPFWGTFWTPTLG